MYIRQIDGIPSKDRPVCDLQVAESVLGNVAYLDADGVQLDREGAVEVIETLTDLIEIHDAAEARKAERAARKLKVGDRVRFHCALDATRIVITDEDEEGLVDVFVPSGLDTGYLARRVPAHRFIRD